MTPEEVVAHKAQEQFDEYEREIAELRAALAECQGQPDEGQSRDQAYMQGFMDGVAGTRTPPTPPAEGLDVERLARAVRAGLYLTDLDDPSPDEAAEAIAREYAALAPKQPE
jgi:hypothetical protein